MNKKEFLEELSQKLISLPIEERDTAMKYYTEYFDDAGVENEQAVITELISPGKVAEGILNESQKNKIADEQILGRKETSKQEKNRINPVVLLVVVLLTLFVVIPVGFPVIFSMLGVVFGFICAGFIISVIGLAIFTIGIVNLFTLTGLGILIMGIGLILFSIGIVFTGLTITILQNTIPPLVRWTVKILRSIVVKGGGNIWNYT